MKTTKTPDEYYQTNRDWQDEVNSLRAILLDTELVEEIKWGAPCYTFQGKNVVGLGAFKKYYGLWFHQGVLLADNSGVLINAQEGKTNALRQWRMTSIDDINPSMITAYVDEAIALAKAGKSVKPARNQPLTIPDELARVLEENPKVKTAFINLKPGLQREYADYIIEAKRAPTKQRRIEKMLPMILAGKGLNDKYR